VKNLKHYINLVENQVVQENVLTNFMTNLKSLLGNEAFFNVRRKRILQVKMGVDSVSFVLPYGVNVTHNPMWDVALVEDAFNKANTADVSLFVTYDIGRVPTDRWGKITGPVPIRFVVSTEKLPNTDFVVGNTAISSEVARKVKSLVPKESTNRCVYLKDVRSDGDQIVISYAYRMAGFNDRDSRSGAPSSEYDQKVVEGLNEYKAIAQELSEKFGVKVVPKEVM
jgi:hypothetical protein